jgi:hypothetical protein
MENRKKFTYRYDEKTEKMLNEGLKEFNLSSLNKLIDKLIAEALYIFPQDQKEMKQEIKDLQGKLKKCQGEKEKLEVQLYKLKEALRRDIENKKIINKLIQEP